jgi:flagellar motor switch protein FliM
MTGNAKVLHKVAADHFTRLKPHKLGRHYHKVPQFIRELSNKYPRMICDYFLRNYRINLELSKLFVHEKRDEDAETVYRSTVGSIGFSLDRSLLTEVLECYYGGVVLPNQDSPPVSISEQRMRNRVGADVARIFLSSLIGEDVDDLKPRDNTYDEAQWEYVVEMQYYSHITQKTASMYIYLDNELVDDLTARMTHNVVNLEPVDTLEKIKGLPVRLNCVIAALQMPLSQVLTLHPGDIVMMRMRDRCDVEINQQKLFRGSLFEDDGALYLTSLESVKTS